MGRPNRDSEHLGRLRDFYSSHRALPPYAELSKLLGFRAKNAAHKLASRLVDSGFLFIGPGRRLVPGARFFERPAIVEHVPAGSGEAGELSGAVDLHEIDRTLVDDPSRTVLVKVRGDSMRDAGVLDGDTAVVERSKNATAGEFVVAMVDGQYTLKELRFESGRPVLMPHNAEFQPIRPTSSLAVFGVVRGIVRRYPRPKPGAASKTRGEVQ